MTTAPRPSSGKPRAYAFPSIERHTLPNGLRIAVAAMPRLPLVTVLALVDAGASCDDAGREGASSLTIGALAEGTTRLDGATLTEQFESLGTGLSSASDWDDATAHIAVTPDRLETAIALLGEVITSPAFSQKDVERLKAERLAELMQQQVEPRGLADDKFAEFLFVPGSRYALPEGGRMASVRALDAAQLRAFHAKRYVPGATTLVFAGDVTGKRAVELAERAVGGWRGTVPPAVPLDDRVAQAARTVHIVNKAGAPQSELRVGHGGVPRSHPDYFPIVVMNALLGGLFSSRINLNLRERNAYTYGARSAFEWRRGSGPFVVSTAVKTEVSEAAAREILVEIGKMREEKVSADELSLATAYLDGVFPIRYETTNAVAQAIAIAQVYGLGDDYYTRYRERIRAVTSDDVLRAAQHFLHPEKLLVVAVGDAAAIRAPMEQLGAGPVTVHEAPAEDGAPVAPAA
ncbi:MAG TPA: pitrilysin family protein [Gemmatimonadaceae bacterium]|nr:pitrilysin family protein [Gemmatimonadaceae bacterium]